MTKARSDRKSCLQTRFVFLTSTSQKPLAVDHEIRLSLLRQRIARPQRAQGGIRFWREFDSEYQSC